MGQNEYKRRRQVLGNAMLIISSGFNYFLCGEPVTLRYRHTADNRLLRKKLRAYEQKTADLEAENSNLHRQLSEKMEKLMHQCSTCCQAE